jgi:hypothetical protein
MPRRPSPTTIIACLALFFSLAGTGIAASRYIITSTSQIKPSVRRSLIAAPQEEVHGLLEIDEDKTKEGEITDGQITTLEGQITKLCESIHDASSYVPNKLTSETLYDIWDKGC